MTPQSILEQFHYNSKKFPKEAVQQAVQQKDQMIPLLLHALEKVSNAPEQLEARDMTHIYAAFLLSQFRETSAFDLWLKILSIPDEDVLEDVLGDCICNSDITLSLFDGQIEKLYAVFESETVNLFAKVNVLNALSALSVCGVVDRSIIIEYFRKLLTDKNIVTDPELLGFLLSDCTDLKAVELKEEIQNLIDTGRADGQDIIHPEEVLSEMMDGGNPENRYGFIDDTIEAMGWWACFKEPKISSIVQPIIAEPIIKVGANDPCPCESGKKYKKCCKFDDSMKYGG